VAQGRRRRRLDPQRFLAEAVVVALAPLQGAVEEHKEKRGCFHRAAAAPLARLGFEDAVGDLPQIRADNVRRLH
jgi:hypothetical protein